MQGEVAHSDAQLARQMRRRRQARNRTIRRLVAAVVVLLLLVAFLVGEFYAGSSDTLVSGTTIAGVDVGGMSTQAAVKELQKKEAALAAKPVVVRAGGHAFPVTEAGLGISVDWAKAVDAARSNSDGFGPFRGFTRLWQSIFGVSVAPAARVEGDKLASALDHVVASVGREPRNAEIVLHGVRPAVVAGAAGISIDRNRARQELLDRFARLDRTPIVLPLSPQQPVVTAAMLTRQLAQVRTALSAPVVLHIGAATVGLSRAQLAGMLRLPGAGSKTVSLGGKSTDSFLLKLEKVINRAPKNATWSVSGSSIHLVADLPGRVMNVPATASNILKAALSPTNRSAAIVVATSRAKRTTKDARAMGIENLVSSYTTEFGGVPNRIHNVQVVSHLIDGTLIAPGATFSFNGTTGDRNAAKGFLTAPVIINGELTTGLGGGVCQVSTTVFNAAYDAGLNITARTNHALYISHYPQGRDATVDYPDIDLKFVNDTSAWLLLRTFVSTYSLTVNLYGTNPHRKVVSTTAPLVTTGPVPTQYVKDPTLPKGTKEVVQSGSQPLATSVHRLVYSAGGKLLYDNTWSSHYDGEQQIVHVGTKPPKKPAGPTGPTGATGATGAVGPTGPKT